MHHDFRNRRNPGATSLTTKLLNARSYRSRNINLTLIGISFSICLKCQIDIS